MGWSKGELLYRWGGLRYELVYRQGVVYRWHIHGSWMVLSILLDLHIGLYR